MCACDLFDYSALCYYVGSGIDSKERVMIPRLLLILFLRTIKHGIVDDACFHLE